MYSNINGLYEYLYIFYNVSRHRQSKYRSLEKPWYYFGVK